MSGPARVVIDDFRGDWFDLSNFGPSPVTVYSALEQRTVTYASGEHAFNVAKTLSLPERRWVAAAPTPKEAKRRGRRVTLRPAWNSTVRYRAMRSVIAAKFAPGTSAAAVLEATGDAHLVEGTTWCDNHWGNCRCTEGARCRCDRAECREPGLNWLGRMLMEHRAVLRTDVTA